MISGSRWLTLRGYQLRAALSVSHLGRKTPSSLRVPSASAARSSAFSIST